MLDVGSGEGSQLDYLTQLCLKGSLIGFDISKDAATLAASHFTSAFWCVADLVQSPFASRQFDTLLNIFSPSNYEEFNRLLKVNGKIIKVVPDKDYLIELRQLLYRDQKEKQSYSNKKTIAKFKEHFPTMKVSSIRYSFALTEEQFQHLLRMTPLSWGATQEATTYAEQHPLESITVHVCLLVGEKKEKFL